MYDIQDVDMGSNLIPIEPVPFLTSQGSTKELYGIFIPNLIFGFLTLGLFRFWAKTRIRRYVFSHMEMQGDSFEYTGTGGELFKGFLIVLFLFFIPFIVLPGMYADSIALQQPQLSGMIHGAQSLLLLVLIPVAIYRSLRYMLSRVTWRGIRFSLTGKALGYCWRWVGLTVLAVVTLGLAYPLRDVVLHRYIFSTANFGSLKVHCTLETRSLYGAFFKAVGIFILGYLIVMGLASIPLYVGIGLTSPEELVAMANDSKGWTLLMMLGVIILVNLAALFAFSFYNSQFLNKLAATTTLGDVQFQAHIRPMQYFRFFFLNMVLLIFTIGMAYPVVIKRYMNFIATHLHATGIEQTTQALQVDRDELSTGEGLADVLDIGAF